MKIHMYFSLNQRFLFSKIIFVHTYLFNSSGSSWNFPHKCVSTRTIQKKVHIHVGALDEAFTISLDEKYVEESAK